MSNAILYHFFSKQGRLSAGLLNSAKATGFLWSTAGRLGLLVVLCLALLLPAALCAAAPQQIQITWSYSGSAVDLAGFRLYKDAALACESTDPAARAMTCTVDLGGASALFTMTAFDVSGAESSQSTAFTLTPPVANQAPISVAQANVLTGPAPLAVFFDGSSSSDPDGYVASSSWNFGDGAGGTSAAVDHTYTLPGLYTAVLTVTDDLGATAQSSIAINVGAVVVPNQPPAALLAASNGSGVAPLAVTFDGSKSSDADGTVAGYAWNFGDGGSASGALVNHSFVKAGSYTVTMTVTDNQGATAQAQTVITVQAAPVANKAPSALLKASVLSGTAPLRVFFDSSGSSDPDGTVATIAWNFGDGATGSGATPSRYYYVAGHYTVTLTVTDNQGATAQAQTTITVQPPPNQAPTAVLSSSVQTGTAPLVVAFKGSGSSDADGTIASYAWTFGDGSTGSGATPSHTYSAAGSYPVTLKVTDNQGATAQAQTVITVLAPPNKAPSAVLSSSIQTGTAPLVVGFNGSGSSDADGTIASYLWTFDDGSTVSGVTALHSYGVAGQYQVTLKVTDNQGATAQAQTTITVQAPPVTNQAPSAVLRASTKSGTAPLVVGFKSRGSSDPDGTIVSFFWEFGDGYTTSGSTTSHTYGVVGQYTVTLTVTDNQGATAQATTLISVTSPTPSTRTKSRTRSLRIR